QARGCRVGRVFETHQRKATASGPDTVSAACALGTTAGPGGARVMKRLGWMVATAGIAGVLILVGSGSRGQQIFQYNFENRHPLWTPLRKDGVEYQETAHRLSADSAHTGKRSELIALECGQGEPGAFIHYGYAVGRAPVADELSVSVWVKANRPGIQLLSR